MPARARVPTGSCASRRPTSTGSCSRTTGAPTVPEEDAQVDCIRLNRAFHGWGHQFLYNRATLAAAVRSAGFASTVFRTYGESERPELTGLERHETWEDTPELPHVLIIEASGSARGAGLDEKELREFREAMGAR